MAQGADGEDSASDSSDHRGSDELGRLLGEALPGPIEVFLVDGPASGYVVSIDDLRKSILIRSGEDGLQWAYHHSGADQEGHPIAEYAGTHEGIRPGLATSGFDMGA